MQKCSRNVKTFTISFLFNNLNSHYNPFQLLKNVAPTLSTFDYDNAVNMMGGGMVDMPVQQMDMGGMSLEMFETGELKEYFTKNNIPLSQE